ncbi:hypothetical protein [Prochlorothrix hollandica]
MDPIPWAMGNPRNRCCWLALGCGVWIRDRWILNDFCGVHGFSVHGFSAG